MNKIVYNVLIVGLGKIGMEYDLYLPEQYIYTHARAFSLHPQFRLVACVDSDLEKQNIGRLIYNVPVYLNVETAVQNHDIDVVVIAVPTLQHLEVFQTIVACSRPQAILCEKPLAYSVQEAHLMLEECMSKNIQLFVNYMRCSDPGAIEIKQKLEMGGISEPIKGIVWYSKGLIHNGSHFLNLLEFWFGAVQDYQLIDIGRLWEQQDSEPEFLVRFKTSSFIFIPVWEEKYSYYGIELLCAQGRLRYDYGGSCIQWNTVLEDKTFTGYKVLSENTQVISSGMARSQWNVVEQLARALTNEKAYLCTGESAFNTLKTLKQIVN